MIPARLRLALLASTGFLVLGGVAAASDLSSAIDQVTRLAGVSWTGLAALQLIALLVGFMPASALAAAAGAMLGLGEGFALSTATLMIGAASAFWLSRSFCRPFIERYLVKRARIAAIDEALGRQGWRLVCLMRVSPVMPFVATSYALGLSRVSLAHYMIGTLASLPALFGYVLMGSLAGQGLRTAGSADAMHLVLLAIGVAATALLSMQVGKIIAKAIRDASAPVEPAKI